MGDVRPGDGLTIRQLLRVLREQVTSVLFVDSHSPNTPPTLTDTITSQYKPPNLTLEEVRDGLIPPTPHILLDYRPENTSKGSMMCSYTRDTS